MNKCLNCGKDVNNKYCNVTCQNKHQGTLRANEKYGLFKDFEVNCETCNKIFIVNEREKLHPQKDKYYCCRSCANTRKLSVETKEKISKSLTKTSHIIKICDFCKKEFNAKRQKQIYCSRSCVTKWKNENTNQARKGGLASVRVQEKTRRSKNEKLFAELCKDYFNNVKCNEPLFNGWDADVILLNEKIAILWNGKWHYEKIKEKHSVKQVQNRDRIKIKEIKKLGYNPYIIKDIGKHNPDFVKEQFKIFLDKFNF